MCNVRWVLSYMPHARWHQTGKYTQATLLQSMWHVLIQSINAPSSVSISVLSIGSRLFQAVVAWQTYPTMSNSGSRENAKLDRATCTCWSISNFSNYDKRTSFLTFAQSHIELLLLLPALACHSAPCISKKKLQFQVTLSLSFHSRFPDFFSWSSREPAMAIAIASQKMVSRHTVKNVKFQSEKQASRFLFVYCPYSIGPQRPEKKGIGMTQVCKW